MRYKRLLTSYLLSSLIFGIFSSLYAEPVRIVTWNVKEAFSLTDVKKRKNDFKKIARELKPDILLLQEVTSLGVVKAIRDTMGLTDYQIICSDFERKDTKKHSSFEVAIISKYPLTQVFEYDPKPEDSKRKGYPDELPLLPLNKISIRSIGTSRGYLWVSIEEIKLTIAVVHLKSSLGQSGCSDTTAAKQREFVIGAVAAGVKEDIDLFPDYAYLVAGDFNVGHSDPAKNGNKLKEDCCEVDCGGKDRYDETHALLGNGIVGKLKMKNLSSEILDTTYPDFPGSPIDNIYVAGSLADRFQPAQKGMETFGSDHLPVWTVYNP